MDLFDLPESELDTPVVDAAKLGKAIDVYREAWREFYDWEDTECRRTIKECERPTAAEIPGDLLPFTVTVGDYEQEFSLRPPPDDPREYFTVEEFDEYENPVRYATLICDDTAREPIRAYPRYESCTPTSYSHVKDLHHGGALAFIPYADNVDFSIERYLQSFESYSWQVDFPNPDLEMIQLEVATRLITLSSPLVDEGYTMTEVDELGILRKLRIHRSSGLLWDTAQRDVLWWSSLPGDLKISRDFVPKTADVFAHINQEIQHFCPKLKCLRSFCATHNYPYGSLEPAKPKLRSDELNVAGRAECGDCCFRYVYREDLPTGPVKWEDPNDAYMVAGILKLLPDESPCNLAVICRKKCFEIFAFRCSKFDDAEIEDGQFPDKPPRILKPLFVDDYMTEDKVKFKTQPPCHHPGPCDQFSCICHQNNQHCQRSCRCEPNCTIRWKGCDCSHSKKSRGVDGPCQSSDKCECRRAGRECEPDVCIRCNARGKKKRKKLCRNVDLQRGKFPTIIIRSGSYGLGAFASRQLPENTMIGEYVGEILRDVEHDSYNVVLGHTGLNYIFDLDSVQSLDAAKLGNETRYLNDSKDQPENNNCVAQVFLIDGEHRIALMTTKNVQPGQELFLSYGDAYWDPPNRRDRNESPFAED